MGLDLFVGSLLSDPPRGVPPLPLPRRTPPPNPPPNLFVGDPDFSRFVPNRGVVGLVLFEPRGVILEVDVVDERRPFFPAGRLFKVAVPVVLGCNKLGMLPRRLLMPFGFDVCSEDGV